nr:ABC transporter, putative [Tanacetum cinerariifolium]
MFPVTRDVLSNPFYSGLLALVVTEAAYMAEIHRGGLISVAKGQKEAGRALGVGLIGMQRLIVIPQAFRISLPTLVNEYITVVKLTSLVSVISLTELLTVGQRLYAQNCAATGQHPEALRAARGAQGHRSESRSGPGHFDHRPVRLGQDHADSYGEQSGNHRPRRNHPVRRGLYSCRRQPQRPADPPWDSAHRHGVSELQPVPPSHHS